MVSSFQMLRQSGRDIMQAAMRPFLQGESLFIFECRAICFYFVIFAAALSNLPARFAPASPTANASSREIFNFTVEMDNNRIILTATDYYDQLASLAHKPVHRELYHELYGLLRHLCETFCGDRVFSNFFSQLGWVCDEHGIDRKLTIALQDLRRRAHKTLDVDEKVFRRDVRMVADFVERLYGEALPAEIQDVAPADYRVGSHDRVVGEYMVLRVRCVGVEGDYLLVRPDSDDLADEVVRVALVVAEYGSDRSYLADIVREGSTLSLLNVRIRDNGDYVPRWIVYEPDCLLSPSELAGVFEPNAVLPHNYFLKSLLPRESTYYTLLGLASGQFLDDIIFQSGHHKATYAESVKKVFARYPLDFFQVIDSKEESTRFHTEARLQFANIKQLVESRLEMVYGFDLSQAMLEPSFVCPALGLAGRMDYLQTDGMRLIEQKSGKYDEYRRTHKEPHFVQMMLYQLMIEYTMGVPHSQCSAYLLYSHYADGLMMERPLMTLLEKALEMRNRIVAMQESFAEGHVAEFFETLCVDDFRQCNISDKLWFSYIRPRVESLLAPFADKRPSVVKSFFFRFYSFLAKEQWLGRVGIGGAHGYADLWNNPALVREENGDMYAGLRTLRLENSVGGDGADLITFAIDAERQDVPTNFRLGDAVQIYAYDARDGEPNVARQFTLRGRIAALLPDEVKVLLSNAQRNLDVFEDERKVFALEHDRVEAGNALLVSGLYSLLTAPVEMQRRFLLHSAAEHRAESVPNADYGAFTELVAKSVAAKELFLVIGPPGSGKTSRALRYMVEEHLRLSSKGKLLLMAYTNRAVDELCVMLEEVIADTPELLADYLRLGSGISAAESCRVRMMSSRVGQTLQSVDDVKQMIGEMRIIVGTISTMMRYTSLLSRQHITAAFVDEASQILEPYLLPFFTIGSIDKFVLVGDQKQLPAVVMQSTADAAITDPELNSLGFTNCANSIFYRMLHRLMAMGRSDLYVQIETQGRMHPLLYGFVNSSFYRGQLHSVPLVHQKRELGELYPCMPQPASEIVNHLARERVLFLDCPPTDDGVNDKVNSAEAARVIDCLHGFEQLYAVNGRQLCAADVGIIVPYRNQIGMIRAKMAESGMLHLADISIDTVERYQGSQRDIVIYSFTVRHASQLEFLTSSTYIEHEDEDMMPYPVDRKLNVALTRAKEQMVLIGHADLLRRNPLFSKMIDTMPVVKP